MTTYRIKNSEGNEVTVIPPLTTTGNSFPIEMIGEMISPYGEYIATNEYRLMENFSSSAAPSNPVTGMTWHNATTGMLEYYTGTKFVELANVNSNYSNRFRMDSTASSIDMTVAGDTVIFTHPGDGSTFYPTGVLLENVIAPTATEPVIFNLYVDAPEDVLENSIVIMSDVDQFAFYNIQGVTKSVKGSDTLKLQVAGTPNSGSIQVKVTLFGFIK